MLNDKKLAKIEKELGKEELGELESLDQKSLQERIASAAGAVKQAQDELEANPQYQDLKTGIKYLSQALGDVKKRQKSIIEYCLHLLEEKGAE